MERLPVLLAIASLFLAFGCIAVQEGASETPAGKPAVPSGVSRTTYYDQPSVPQPAPPENPSQTPSEPENKAEPPSVPNATVAFPPTEPEAPAPEPIAVFAILSQGGKLDFGEGAVTLDDIWVYSQVLPAIITLRNSSGSSVWQKQVMPGLEASYSSPSGRRFWIYVASTDAGFDIYVKRAAIYALEAREKGESFDKSLYQDVLPSEAVATINQSREFSGLVIGGLLNKSQNMSANGFRIKFEALRRYPEDKTTAMASIYDSRNKLIGFSSVPLGGAYAFAMPDTSIYAIYNRAAGVGQSGLELAELRVYRADTLSAGRLYRVVGFSAARQSNMLVEKLEINGGFSEVEDRRFYLHLADFSTSSTGNEFAAIEIYDDDGIMSASGMATKSEPMAIRDTYGRKYSAWLDGCDASAFSCTVSVYRVP